MGVLRSQRPADEAGVPVGVVGMGAPVNGAERFALDLDGHALTRLVISELENSLLAPQAQVPLDVGPSGVLMCQRWTCCISLPFDEGAGSEMKMGSASSSCLSWGSMQVSRCAKELPFCPHLRQDHGPPCGALDADGDGAAAPRQAFLWAKLAP